MHDIKKSTSVFQMSSLCHLQFFGAPFIVVSQILIRKRLTLSTVNKIVMLLIKQDMKRFYYAKLYIYKKYQHIPVFIDDF